MTPIRPSITNRRLTMPSMRNLQNEDKEFKDQLKVWYRRQEMHEQKEEQVRKYVSPTRDDTLQQQQKMKMIMEDQLDQKRKIHSEALKLEQDKSHYEDFSNKYCGPHNLDATLSKIREKKENLKNMMEENKQREREKVFFNTKTKEMEIEADHIRAKIPCCWNRRHYL